eukprot:sb/3463747/
MFFTILQKVIESCSFFNWSSVFCEYVEFLEQCQDKDRDFAIAVSESIVTAGIPSLIVKLFDADFSEGADQVLQKHGCFDTSFTFWCLTYLLTFQEQKATNNHKEALNVATRNIVDKFLDKRYNLTSLSTLATLILPRIVRYQCVRNPTEVCTSLRIIFENMEILLPFMEMRNIVYILKRTSIRLPKATEKKFLDVVKKNLSSPFYLPCVQKDANYLPKIFQIDSGKYKFDFSATLIAGGVHLIGKLQKEKILNTDDPKYGPFYESLQSVLVGYFMPDKMLEEIQSVYPKLNDVHILEIFECGEVTHEERKFQAAANFFTCALLATNKWLQGKKYRAWAESFLELGKYQEALADSVFEISQIHHVRKGIALYGDDTDSTNERNMTLQMFLAKVRRIKILVHLKEWSCALRCCIEAFVTEESILNVESEIMEYYYQSLIKYSSKVGCLQYPPFCIRCQSLLDSNDVEGYLLKQSIVKRSERESLYISLSVSLSLFLSLSLSFFLSFFLYLFFSIFRFLSRLGEMEEGVLMIVFNT